MLLAYLTEQTFDWILTVFWHISLTISSSLFVKTVSWSLVIELQGSGARANCSSEATSKGKLWTQGGTRRKVVTEAVWNSSTREGVVTRQGEGHIAIHFRSYHVMSAQ